MSLYSHPQRRFPPPCRFFAQGNCREGEGCLFAHQLPFKAESPAPSSATFARSVQKAIRDLELDLLQTNYQHCIRQTSATETGTQVHLTLPPGTESPRSPLRLVLSVPQNYPDTPSCIHVQNTDMGDLPKEAAEWHPPRHQTLVQQLDWFLHNHHGTQ